MRLFISNFKKIFVILGIFLALFLGYNAFIVLAKPQVLAFQNQQQGNMVFAQDYLYAIGGGPDGCWVGAGGGGGLCGGGGGPGAGGAGAGD